MQCKRGIYIQNQSQTVPCGQCIHCRINKGRIWTSRILQEWITHPAPSYFVTLTYDEDNVPWTDQDKQHTTLRKKAFLKWVNNTQQRVAPFRYYAVGEYGDASLRPHYHMALFSRNPAEAGKILASWDKGFTQATQINPSRARYLANYTTKKLTSATDSRLESNQEPEFRASSRRPPLGASFVDRIVAQYDSHGGKAHIQEKGDVGRTFRLDGRIYPLGPWALTKIRTALQIPVLHRERLAHPKYLDYYEIEEAECDENWRQIEKATRTKMKQGFHRGKGQKI